MMAKCAIILLCIIYMFQKADCRIKGRPLLEVKRIFPCEEFENVIILNAHISEPNGTTQYATGNLTFVEDAMDASYKAHLTIARLIKGAWHTDISVSKDDPCNSLKMLGPIYAEIQRAAHVSGCPVQKGTYSVTNFPIDGHTLPLMYATGLFRVECKVYKMPKNILKLCYRAETQITLEK